MEKIRWERMLLFIWAMLSLIGLLLAFVAYDCLYCTFKDSFMQLWVLFSIPLIVHLIYIAIFRRKDS